MKQLLYGDEAREALKKGVKMVYDAVSSTMGAGGHTVIIDSYDNNPHITADGVTVAYAVESEEPFVCTGVALTKRVAMKSNLEAQDGTTTATVLAHTMLENDHLVTGLPPILVKKGMELAQEDIMRELSSMSKKANNKTILQSALIASRGDEVVSNLINEGFKHVGKDGYIQVDASNTSKTSLEKIAGYQLDGGYQHPQYINVKSRNRVEFNDPIILITSEELLDLNLVFEALTKAAAHQKPIILISNGCSEPIDKFLIANAMQGKLQIAVVKPQEFGANQAQILQDLAFVTQSEVAGSAEGKKLSEISQYGTCNRVIVTESETIFMGLPTPIKEINKYVSELEKAVEFSEDKDLLERRLTRMKGKLARLLVGAETEVELKEKKDRVDDCIGAVRCALKEGYVPGGGKALLYIQQKLQFNLSNIDDKSIRAGYEFVLSALDGAITTIIRNSVGEEYAETIVMALKDTIDSKLVDYGFNAKTLEYCSLYEDGIIDPTLVTKVAVKAAISIVKIIIETNCIIGVVGESNKLDV